MKPTTVLERQGLFVQLYELGFSTRQVSYLTGFSKSYIYKCAKESGVLRDRRTALWLRQPAESTHWRSSRKAARKAWERLLGPIPERWHVHHKDRDFTNNSVENLELLTPGEHAHVHHPPNPIPRHLREERRRYMKEYLKSYRSGERRAKTRVM